MKKTLLLMAVNIICSIAIAQNINTSEEVMITQPVYEDLYIAAGTVTIQAPVHGDVIVGGGTITINDTITGDILIGGGKVTINGYTGDDVRGAGGEVYIGGKVDGDIALSGGTLTIASPAVIAGNVMLAGGTMNINGSIGGNLKSVGGKINMNGTVGKQAYCQGEELNINGTVNGKSKISGRNILIGNNAAFYNDVEYWTKDKKPDFKQSIKKGDALYEPTLEMDTDKWQYLGFASILGMLWYIAAVFIFIVAIQHLFGPTMKKAAVEISTHLGRSIGYGFLFWVAIPLAIVVLFITIIGIPVSVLLLLLYILLALLATVISSVVFANWINEKRKYNWSNWKISFAALGIFVLLKFITSIPLIGWLAMAVVASMVFGAVLWNINWKRKTIHVPA